LREGKLQKKAGARIVIKTKGLHQKNVSLKMKTKFKRGSPGETKKKVTTKKRSRVSKNVHD